MCTWDPGPGLVVRWVGLCDLVKADIKTPFRLFISTEECDWASQISHLWALDLFWLWV